jgi:hypothetical protein
MMAGLPSVASFGLTTDGLEVHIAHGRVYVGFEGHLLAYYSEIPQVDIHVCTNIHMHA